MMRYSIFAIVILTFAASGCGRLSNFSRFNERSSLLNSAGPEVDAADYLEAIENMRKFGPNYDVSEKAPQKSEKAPQKPSKITDENDLLATRDAIFAQVDRECDAYMDAIFWGARTRNTATTSLGLIGATTTAVLAATGVGATAIAVTAAGFGLSTALIDSYYETFLYNLEPSGIVGLMKSARSAYRASPDLINPRSEGMLLAQAQGYIRQCSPPKIESLVNIAVQKGQVIAIEKQTLQPLSTKDLDTLTKLRAKNNLTLAEAIEVSSLIQRMNVAGIAMVESDPGDVTEAAGTGGAEKTSSSGRATATGVPTTTIQ